MVTVCFAAQVASVLVCLLFYLPLCAMLFILLENISILQLLQSVAMMGLYLLAVNSVVLIATHLVSNLMQMIVTQTALGVMQLLLTSSLLFNSGFSALMDRVMRALPGYYLISVFEDGQTWVSFALVSVGWLVASVLLSSVIDRDANTGKIHLFRAS